MFVCCERCVLSGRGLCDKLITHPEESYRMWCVVVCDLETSRGRRPWPELGRRATGGGGGGPYNIREIVVFYQISCGSTLMMITFATEERS